jgi:hypothetical protein
LFKKRAVAGRTGELLPDNLLLWQEVAIQLAALSGFVPDFETVPPRRIMDALRARQFDGKAGR